MVDNPNNFDENTNGNDPFFEEDDFLSAERFDEFEDNAGAPAEKMNWKEVWDKNPSVKIFAVVAGLAVLLIGYMAFGGSSSTEEDFSVVKQTRDVSEPPGTTELPPAYEEAVRKASEERAELAAMTHGSSIPTPIARPSERIEAPVQVEEIDPLSAWRREAEARRPETREPVVSLDNMTPPPVSLPDLPDNTQNNQLQLNAQPQQPVNPPLPTAPPPETVQALAQQMQQQMQTVLETQVPRESVVVSMNIVPGYNINKYFPADDGQGGGSRNTIGDDGRYNTSAGHGGGTATGGNYYANAQMANAGANMAAEQKPIVAAGTIAYAQILTQANSDVPGPVLAEIASTPLVGGRAIGQFQVAENHLVLQFSRIVKDGKEYPIQGFALDPATTLPGVATRIHNHYFTRVFLPAAARFIEGFAEAATRQESSSVVTNGTVVTTTGDKLDTKQEVMEGVNLGAQEISRILEDDSDRPKTIIVDAGTRIGILFMSSVFDPTAMQNQMQNQYAGGYYGGQNLPNTLGALSGLTPAGAAYNAYNAYSNYNAQQQPMQYQQQYQPQYQQPQINSQYNYSIQPPQPTRPIGF